MSEIERLYRLQEIDEQLAMNERRLQELFARRRQMEQGLAEARAAREALEKAVVLGEQSLRRSESDLRDVESRLQELERRLYGGAVRSEKELTALQSEIEQLRRQKDTLESRALELLLDLDGRRGQARLAAEAEARQAHELETAGRAAAAEEAALREATASLRTARDEVAAQVSPRARALYEQVRHGTPRPVARVLEGRCEGCRLDVALLTRKAALGGSLVRCENCGRILFVS